MDEQVIAKLVDEVEDVLPQFDVGLYELPDMLRGDRYPVLDDGGRRRYAEEALRRLLAHRNRRLVWAVWPDDEPVGETILEQLDERKWEFLPDGRYVVLRDE